MRLMPFDAVADVYTWYAGVENDILRKGRRLPVPRNANRSTQRSLFDNLYRIRLVDHLHMIQCAGIDIPRIILLRIVGEGLQLIATTILRNGIKTGKSAKKVFRQYTDLHLEIGIKSMSEIAERGEHIRHYKW